MAIRRALTSSSSLKSRKQQQQGETTSLRVVLPGVFCFSLILSLSLAFVSTRVPSSVFTAINDLDHRAVMSSSTSPIVNAPYTCNDNVCGTSDVVDDKTTRTSTPTLYACTDGSSNGMEELRQIFQDVLPEYEMKILTPPPQEPKRRRRNFVVLPTDTFSNDVFIGVDVGRGILGCETEVYYWLLTKFNGRVVVNSPESPHEHLNSAQHHKGLHYFGPVIEPRQNIDMRLTYLQTTWWTYFQDLIPPKAMTDPTVRPKLKKKPATATSTEDGERRNFDDISFMVYAHGNCVDFRDFAAWQFSKYGAVTCSGKCCGRALDDPNAGNQTNLIKQQSGGLGSWRDNVNLFAAFKFCLVLEHEYDHAAYITEKIMMSFIAGCVPIYHGPTEMIFDIFNRDAFIFYNVSNPQLSLDLVATLSQDESAYDTMQNQPILAHGGETVAEYFSFNETVGGGKLKQRYRNILGLTTTSIR
mmetsp:Transcript_4540/g.11501  ORF Transcript_4540/g.11501 Transcript_4540/m.11501 type:complete len:470 (-) Transcript_4540:2626-4035(-)